MIVTTRFASLIAVLAMTAVAQPASLGHVDFPTSGSNAAQNHFIQGVLLLHSFEYSDSREEFQAASKLDPGFAMAYWGEALTYTHPVWVEQDVPSARAALQRLAPTPEVRRTMAPTLREKDYLETVEILYGDGDKISRDIAYANAMGRLMKKYPGDLEAASLYAVALLGTCQFERQYPVYMRAAAVAEEVYAKNPQHPGAIHYLIHAYDDPIHAPLGLRAARVYADVAGSASHAQHMPSHIFFALGMWDDAVAANRRSVAVADERIKRKGLGPDQRNYHSLLWLEYAYLQEGRYEEARAVIADVERTGSARGLPMMKTVYALETGKIDESLGNPSTTSTLIQSVASLNGFGLAAARNGRIDDARSAFDSIRKSLTHSQNGGSPASLKTAEIMMQQLQAELWLASGRKAQALELLARTATEEDALTFEFGPPIPVKPAHELYAEELLAANRPREARDEFQRALARAPKRAQSLRGLVKAASAAGDHEVSRSAAEDLKSFWRGDKN